LTVTDEGSSDPGRLRLLAGFVAGRALGVAETRAGEPPHTDGRLVFVSPGRSVSEQRREMLVQAALLGAGSLEPEWIQPLRGRRRVARRYLALEGRRALAELAARMPLAAALGPHEATTASADESLAVARSRRQVADPPAWFGALSPSRLLAATEGGPGARAGDRDLRLQFRPTDVPSTQEGGEEPGEESKILGWFSSPLASDTFSDFFHKLLGGSRSAGDAAAGGGMPTRSLQRADGVGPSARPLPVPIRIVGDTPGATAGVRGVLHPEWDVYQNRYKPEHCRVIEFRPGAAPEATVVGVARDEVLRRRLTRLGLGPKVVRRQPDGDDLDVEALIDLFVDLRAGHSPPEHVYLERRKQGRDLGVLILVDASGSATDTDPEGRSVHEHQRRAAATLALTLEELGDRVAVYGFRSHGRGAVHLLALKRFAQRFGAGGRARLDQLRPAGYTRLGAAIRHAGEILDAEAGTPHRLLLVLSDGFPYDDGYESRYAEADTHRSLEELRAAGIACLCLSIGGSTPAGALHRVFGSASHASAPTLGDLSPRMDELFLAALRELAAPKRRAPRRARA
jgi:nitric oxide reductase NorD protein